MNKKENEKNIKLQPLGWLVIPDSLFNEGSEAVSWVNLYYDNNYKIVTPTTSQKDKESNETAESKQMSFWEKLRWLCTNK